MATRLPSPKPPSTKRHGWTTPCAMNMDPPTSKETMQTPRNGGSEPSVPPVPGQAGEEDPRDTSGEETIRTNTTQTKTPRRRKDLKAPPKPRDGSGRSSRHCVAASEQAHADLQSVHLQR
eukprot:scaffold718_cov342-Pavlova_lutheri.AAC.2